MSLELADKRKSFMASLRKDAVKEIVEHRRRMFLGLMADGAGKGDCAQNDEESHESVRPVYLDSQEDECTETGPGPRQRDQVSKRFA